MDYLPTILHAIGAFLVLGGALFCVIGGIGIIRLPEFYSRCHGAGVTDSAGAGGVLFGLCFFAEPLVMLKLIVLLAFLWISSVVSTHSLAKAAFSKGVRIVNVPRKDWTIPPPAPDELERITQALPPAAATAAGPSDETEA